MKGIAMFKVLLNTGWIYDLTPWEAAVYKEEGYYPIHM